jgi:hypothetical protein
LFVPLLVLAATAVDTYAEAEYAAAASLVPGRGRGRGPADVGDPGMVIEH